jgi:hypothetical protein
MHILLEQNFMARVALVYFEVCALGFFTVGRKIVLQRDCVPGARHCTSLADGRKTETRITTSILSKNKLEGGGGKSLNQKGKLSSRPCGVF